MDASKPTTALFDVYLRLRPSSATDKERFLDLEDNPIAPTHVTIHPPANDHRKRAIERFAFTRVYEEHVGQREIFESTGVLPLVEGVLGGHGREGRDGLVATLGVTGSGKSHTILGSKSQRGITQLTLDVLFQQTSPYLVDAEMRPIVFQSLCSADVSEAYLLPASAYLDSIYSSSENGGFSRATTPALVRDSARQSTIYKLPGSLPSLEDSTSSGTRQPVFDRLYPSLAKYQDPPPTTPSHLSLPHSRPNILTRSIAKLTSHLQQESSFLSAPSSKRYMPRVSTFPQSPPLDDVTLDIDTSAEYAIVVSMYEVYNDRIFDLLAVSTSSKTPQKRRALLFKPIEQSPDRKVVAGLRKVICSTLDEALLVLETGLHERRVAGTGSNAASSRSHGFFCLDVKKRRRPANHAAGVSGPWSSSTLTIVDLAGSERARTAKTAGATLAEAGKINESLMYLGQCMQMQSDNARNSLVAGGVEKMVPFRQCKLTELLFSNSFSAHGAMQKAPQKAIMIVTADPLGDFNATSQILRYSALAREVTVPRIPSVTSTFLSGAMTPHGKNTNGRTTPSAAQEDLEQALTQLSRLQEELEVTQVLLEEETFRRQEAEASWQRAESRIEEVEAEIREELVEEMEAQLQLEQRRWRAARDVEMDAQDEHVDRKLELLTQQMSIYEDETAEQENTQREELTPCSPIKTVKKDSTPSTQQDVSRDSASAFALKYTELEDENAMLREKLAGIEREREQMRSPSKKLRVLKPSRRWMGSAGVSLEDV
ncbi:hypothetical protein LTR91_009266 [Friedmanniomyces endolithicus]|uniref:Kinesin-like protein n=2 Tax=Dothideomycetidae TaxID=451867 RepID=A0AAN6QTB9_9PEZI|nr:hypothetical protein LTR57_014592 [Friedmanniomyces endolithicus]KAK0964928.1 hypothetical protein LTS01_018613 [Friedmanniomyces endolithicus]KAK0989261.1 hypothetical protein LTR91_009266 [Friedmanniomyces endolithicus]KAK1032107.1 hypothetical protein LTS16_017446 [Friedmanniomyces endolithicus]